MRRSYPPDIEFAAIIPKAVLSVIKLVYDTLSLVTVLPIEKEKLLGFVRKAIDGIASFLDAINVFKHGAKTLLRRG